MNRKSDRRVFVLIVFALCCPSLAGCGKNLNVLADPATNENWVVCREAKTHVMGLDYILRTSDVGRINSAFNELAACFSESRKVDWGKEAEKMERLSVLSLEVKALLKEKPPKLEDARPKVDEMMKVAKQLPGDEAWLPDVWTNLKKS